METDLIRSVLAGQAQNNDCKNALSEALRGVMIKALVDQMKEEVVTLCGPHYHPAPEAAHKRAGSTSGKFRLNGAEARFARPRVRRKQGREVWLKTYAAVRDADQVQEEILRAVTSGVSTRDMRRVHPNGRGFSASEVSRHWAEGSSRYLEILRGRDLRAEPLAILMLDGIVLSGELVVIVALGIFGDGHKRMLDFEVGSAESYEVGKALMARLEQRGVRFGGRPLCILDGSVALKRSVLARYPEAVVQRCLVHKERNLRGCLSRKDYPELNRLMNRLRQVQGAAAAREALVDLKRFVAGKNQKALASVEEAGEELIALHLLEAPSTLQVSLLSTNAVENPIRNFRAKTRRVTRWRPQSDMSERWTAYAMLTVEQGFRRICGYQDLPVLLRALGWTAENMAGATGTVTPDQNRGDGTPQKDH
jgi:transposase-like protein